MADAPSYRNALAEPLTATVRELYYARVLSEQRREELSVALEMLRALSQKLERARDENIHLRAQLRAAFSGRTIAEERQQLEDEASLDDSSSEPQDEAA